jgi:heterodisulfide reductase subunit C
MNDALRAMSLAERKVAQGTAVPAFNEIFLKSVRKRGRVYELGLMAAFKLRTGRLTEDAGKAPMMLSKGKLPLLAHSVGGRAQRKAMFRRATQGGAQ